MNNNLKIKNFNIWHDFNYITNYRSKKRKKAECRQRGTRLKFRN